MRWTALFIEENLVKEQGPDLACLLELTYQRLEMGTLLGLTEIRFHEIENDIH